MRVRATVGSKRFRFGIGSNLGFKIRALKTKRVTVRGLEFGLGLDLNIVCRMGGLMDFNNMGKYGK